VNTPDDYPATPLRRRALLLLLAVVTAGAILLMLIYRPGDPKRGTHRVVPAGPAKPAQGAASGVGGKADVILLPAGASSPR
jgi:hypothetical protein